MKKLFTLMLVIAFTLDALSQVPEKIGYQAVIRDSGNNLIINHNVGMRISILQGSATGTIVYVENQTPTTNINGLISIEIGGGIPVTGMFGSIDWSTDAYFIKTETDPVGGTNYNITGTSQILSVPYALYAKTASNHFIGESYGGGIVFYVYDNGQHGLIAAKTTAGQMRWYAGTYTYTMAYASGIGAGKTNTALIIASQGYGDGNTYAARYCNEYTITENGVTYADWYLPSNAELTLMYQKKSILGINNGSFYWSSNESTYNYEAYEIAFSVGGFDAPNKQDKEIVRPIRMF